STRRRGIGSACSLRPASATCAGWRATSSTRATTTCSTSGACCERCAGNDAGMSKGYVCPECGLDYDSIAPKDTAVAIRSYPRRLKALVAPIDRDQATRPDAKIRRRPDPHTWSALEYTAHVADIFDTFADI